MNEIGKKYVEFFYKSKSKRIRKAKAFLDSRGVKIENLMNCGDVDTKEDFDRLIGKIGNKDYKEDADDSR